MTLGDLFFMWLPSISETSDMVTNAETSDSLMMRFSSETSTLVMTQYKTVFLLPLTSPSAEIKVQVRPKRR